MQPTISQIPLDQIDDPNIPMRSQMDDEKLEELCASIKSQGLIQPITVRKVGERYEVVAGHRRLMATKLGGFATISAIIRELDDQMTDSVRMQENLFREDINPVDEARYIAKMIDIHQVEPAKLAEMTGKSVAYLQARYDLLHYPPYLIDAVEDEKISLTAAQWLSRITDEQVQKEYTRFATLGGITARRAEAWYRSWEAGNLPREASEYTAPVVEQNHEPKPIMQPCVLCRNVDDIQNMQMWYGHRDCARAVEQMQKGIDTV